ncbi:hypothetical protein CPB86DRAFT_144768 [Serendipita vermifera]|nr:hypothetical protein CPB86DRAFT_144768 [Serendipita vermifera]
MSKRPISVGLTAKDNTSEALPSPSTIQPTSTRTLRKRPGLALLPKENSGNTSSGTPVTSHADSSNTENNGNENALAPIQQRSPTRRVVPKKSRLAGILAPKPSISQFATANTPEPTAAKPSQKSAKENATSRPKSTVANPTISSDAKKLPTVEGERERRPRGRLTGSASRLGGLGNIVRHASKGLLKDVTNNTRKEEADKFVDVGVEDVEQEAEEDADRTIVDIHGHAIMRLDDDDEEVALSPADRDVREFARNDPDIEEIMVVKRQKDRSALDFDWAQQAQDDAGFVTQTDTEQSSRSKTGWWKRGSSRGRKSSSSFLKELAAATQDDTPVVEPKEAPQSSSNDKGSLVIRAIRSVRSLAQIASGSGQRTVEAKPKPAEKPKQSNPPSAFPPNGKHRLSRQKRSGIFQRRASDSNAGWESSAASSSDVSKSTASLVPTNHSRSVSCPTPSINSPISDDQDSPEASAAPSDDDEPVVEATPRPRPPRPAQNNNNRLSIVSILSTDSGAQSSSAETKQNRRSSNGSNIRWDPEAMSEQARKVRKEREERMRLKAQLEREQEAERIRNGEPPAQPEKKKSLNSKRRTPLSAIFDIDTSPAKAYDQDVSHLEEEKTPTSAVFPQRDPLALAMEALINSPMARQEPPVVPKHNANRRVSAQFQPIQVDSPKDAYFEEPVSSPQLSRRASGSGFVSAQVAAWPPAPPSMDPTSPPQQDAQPIAPRLRTRTSSSSTSAPPSAFHKLIARERDEEGNKIPSLTLSTLRSEQGNVSRKARYYNDLDREATLEMEMGIRPDGHSEDGSQGARRRSRVFSNPSSTLQSPTDTILPQSPSEAGTDPVDDLPEDLTIILSEKGRQLSPMTVDGEECASPSTIISPTSSMASPQEFVYTGVDAQPEMKAKVSPRKQKKQDGNSSLGEIRFSDIMRMRRRSDSTKDVFDTDRSAQGLSLHGRHLSGTTSLGSIDNTFDFITPANIGDVLPRESGITTVVSETKRSTSPFASQQSLCKDQPSPSLIRDISTASDVSCETPQRSGDSPGSLFGSQRKGKKSPRKLYGGLLSPTSHITSFGRADVSIESEAQSKVECLDGELVAMRASGAASPCEEARQRKVSTTEPQPEREAAKESAKEDLAATEVRPRPRTVGHRRARTFHARPLSLYIPNEDNAEEDRFPSHSRRYSSVNGFESFAALHNNDPFSAESEEPSMVLRRYYAFQREVEEALNQSRSQWRNTAFSDDELSTFELPEIDQVEDFLEASKKSFVELPRELRARRRARAAPYLVPSSGSSDEKGDSPTETTFKGLSTWDHRRTRKVSDDKPRQRKLSEEKIRVRKVSEKKSKRSHLSALSLPNRRFSPFVDAGPESPTTPTEEGTKRAPSSLNSTVNSISRAKLAKKVVEKLEIPAAPLRDASGKENALRPKHSIEGMLESPTGSLRISRPRPKRRGLSTTSPPASIRL